MTDEEIIKRKLLFDGEGTSDERRINVMQKIIAKWISMKSISEAENVAMYNQILSILTSIEHSRLKSNLVKRCYNEELEKYKTYQDEIADNIGCIKEAINTSKGLLSEVKLEKYQKQNYNMLANDIIVEHSRQETSKYVEELNRAISDLQGSKQKLNDEWLRWCQQFKVITTSTHQLRLWLNKS